MKKYKVVLGGRGAEVYVFKLTSEQKQKFVEGEIEKDKMDLETVYEILGISFISETDETYSGPYIDSESFIFEVYDEEGKLVWDSYNMEKDWDFDQDSRWDNKDGYESVSDDENLLIAEDYTKGNFREFILEIEEDFDPSKLLPMDTEIAERIQIITGIFYDGKRIEQSEWGDTWSKGLYFYLT